ncbi:MAG: DUF423 domain-containing protein [Pseudomonadota bacterium]
MNWIAIAALNMALAVMTGAFGAHALKARLSPEALGWWQTAVAYQMWHALGLLALGVMLRVSLTSPALPVAGVNTAAVLLQLGILIFSGSLYAMALGAPRWFGAITPIGGLAFMAGWLWLAWHLMRDI